MGFVLFKIKIRTRYNNGSVAILLCVNEKYLYVLGWVHGNTWGMQVVSGWVHGYVWHVHSGVWAYTWLL